MQKACIILIILWVCGLKTLIGEYEFLKYLKTNDIKHLEKAVYFDNNSMYQSRLSAYYFEKAPHKALEYIDECILSNNGDLTAWGLWYLKAQLHLKRNDVFMALKCLEKALEYNPDFEDARNQFENIISHGVN